MRATGAAVTGTASAKACRATAAPTSCASSELPALPAQAARVLCAAWVSAMATGGSISRSCSKMVSRPVRLLRLKHSARADASHHPLAREAAEPLPVLKTVFTLEELRLREPPLPPINPSHALVFLTESLIDR